GSYVSYLRENYDNTYENMGTATSWVSYGPQWAEAGSAPFSRHKGYTREGGIVSPMIISGPGVAARGAINTSYLTVMDLAPTFLALGDAEYPMDGSVSPMLGESIVGLLSGNASFVHDDSYTTTLFHGGRAFLRQGKWTLVNLEPPFDESKFELFDVEADPGETTNLAEAEPERLALMIELWRVQRRELGIVLPQDL
ncbi:MAG: sulfatase/phosphatase domain-containing protein, partial [Acidobacteriota bacterium]